MENTSPNNEIWQIESGGDVVETSFDEMTAWIAEGSLLKIDRVRKGDLRWIEAGKVPSLIEFFNAKDAAAPPEPVITMTHKEQLGVVEQPQQFRNSPLNRAVKQPANTEAVAPAADVCAMHPDAPARYICDTCLNAFCKACPTGYGANVKICPFCGAMCRAVEEIQAKDVPEARFQAAIGEGFGFADFGRALAFPFRFKASLVLGALMFMIFSIGQGVAGFGGIFMMFGAVMCFMMANTLTFGILANTVENFSQGKLDENFMPSFDDFSVWDDVVHPFFLSIGVYISSFGPFIAVVLVSLFLIVGSVTNEMNAAQADAARVVNPGLPYAAKAANQSEQVKDLIKNTNDRQMQRMRAMERGEVPPDATITPVPPGQNANVPTISEDEQFEQLDKFIAEQRKAQLESAVGKSPETIAAERTAMFEQIRSKGLLLLLLLTATGLWGLFYFPAACAVAGYTRSFMATINPFVGLDTIKHLGGSYVLILIMAFLLAVASGVVGGVLSVIFAAFDMPALGNIPAKAIGSLFGFYTSVVFACVIGYALFKNSDKLKLFR